MKQASAAIGAVGLACLFFSGCGPDVRTDFPRDKMYGSGDTIRVYDMDNGEHLLSLSPRTAAVYSEGPHIWKVSAGVNSDGKPQTESITIRQIVVLTFTYTVVNGRAPEAGNFTVYSATGERALESPDDCEIRGKPNEGAVTLALRYGFENPADSLSVDYFYGGFHFNKTAGIHLSVAGTAKRTAAPKTNSSEAATTATRVTTEAVTASPAAQSSRAAASGPPAELRSGRQEVLLTVLLIAATAALSAAVCILVIRCRK